MLTKLSNTLFYIFENVPIWITILFCKLQSSENHKDIIEYYKKIKKMSV